jgi:RNA polymerase sigma-70 factor (ECF subfamily)
VSHLDFNALLIKHLDDLNSYALYLTGDAETAKNLVQETLLKALEHQDKYDPSQQIRWWLYKILKNTHINHFRRSKRIQICSMDVVNTPEFAASISGGETADGQLLVSELESLINDMPHVVSDLVRMYYEGYKYVELADLFKEQLGTIKSRMHYARKILKGRIDR